MSRVASLYGALPLADHALVSESTPCRTLRRGREQELLLARLRQFFATPGRQAAAWVALGVAGLLLAGVGVLAFTGGDDGAGPLASAAESPTGAATSTPTRTPSPPPTSSPPATTSPSPTAIPAPQANTNTNTGQAPEPTSTPTTEPTPTPTPEAGAYCGNSGPTSPPDVRIAGTLTIAGQAAPAGEPVTIAFNGVQGPTRDSRERGTYGVDFSIGGADCANRPGASISLIIRGQNIETGLTVPTAGPLIRFDAAVP